MAVPGQKATKQFPNSSTGSDEDIKVYCQSCDQDGPRLPAYSYCTNCSEHLCETCFTVHKRHKLSRHHTLLDKTIMPQTMSPVTQSQSDSLTKPCPKHNIEMIKFYCHDHKALLCSVCVTLEHTPASCKVNYIPDVSDQVINSAEYHDMMKAIDIMTKEINTFIKKIKGKNDASNRSLTDAQTDIKTFRTKINKRLDEIEKQVEEAAKTIQKENSSTMTRVETECGDISKVLKDSSDAINHFNTSKQANDLFMELRKAEEIIKDYRQSLTTLTSINVKEYKFEPNAAISNLFSQEKSIGTLKGTSVNYLKSRQISHKDQIYVQTSKDYEYCCITGMTLLTPSYLIITDRDNMAVKMIDINRKSVLNQQKLDSHPWGVSSVSHDEIAVTIPNKHVILFMSVSENNLKKKHTLKVDGNCYGISCHNDKMVVSFGNPGKVQILLVNGTALHTIQDDDIFKWPFYVTTNDNYIYVSDSVMKTITKLNWQGEVKGKYNCRSEPYGLIMSDDGTLFVCLGFDNTIREISGGFTKEQTVIKDIIGPQTVCWSAETCTLYTSADYDKRTYYCLNFQVNQKMRIIDSNNDY